MGYKFSDPAHGYFIRAAKPPRQKSYVPDYEGLRAVEPSRTGWTAFSRRYIRLFRSQSECISPVNPIVSRSLPHRCLSTIDRPAGATRPSNRDSAISPIIVSRVSLLFLLLTLHSDRFRSFRNGRGVVENVSQFLIQIFVWYIYFQVLSKIEFSYPFLRVAKRFPPTFDKKREQSRATLKLQVEEEGKGSEMGGLSGSGLYRRGVSTTELSRWISLRTVHRPVLRIWAAPIHPYQPLFIIIHAGRVGALLTWRVSFCACVEQQEDTTKVNCARNAFATREAVGEVRDWFFFGWTVHFLPILENAFQFQSLKFLQSNSLPLRHFRNRCNYEPQFPIIREEKHKFHPCWRIPSRDRAGCRSLNDRLGKRASGWVSKCGWRQSTVAAP